ncbi:hypothetical protein CHU93_09610 [Sandarakinorhabdus cyanobacteriorum]|uniref:Lysophospholipase n=1 Tax=Sandarakinorhabdus cyanobacteriorum TaxID=1981098 RepID=A0A255YG13_9SPHN|nr:DUF3089 domain-containing protein [Sandarakinorhabdus cyanobacteriorum]OYQ28212.1 hypothetical protein CHU93_09610 [Sandarakinorhabdus cyanobacteriorum]
MKLPLLPLLALLAAPVVAAEAPDYRKPESWLCRPGAADPCSGDASVSRVAADAVVTLDILPAAKKPKIDCFYVYPTVSTDPGPNSDMVADPAEKTVALAQATPFRQACRLFAPLYRQVTLAALRDRLMGKGDGGDRAMAYADVKAAWDDYLKHDNKGRGVALIGHSQGSGVLKALIANEIEGKPVARQMIAAYLAGTNVLVPQGADVGGDFKATPLCRAADQTGCALAWVSFRDTMAVPPASLFGRPPASAPAGMAVACTNPAALAGGRATLRPLMVNRTGIVDNGTPVPKWAKGRNIYTPFVALPGLLTGECMARDNANVLSIGINADPADPRTDTINGDVMIGGQIIAAWGLHLIDMQVVMEDLVALAQNQGATWLRQNRK